MTDESSTPSNRMHCVSVVLILGLVYCVYLPGLGGPFVLDDFPVVVGESAFQIKALNVESLREAAFATGDWYPRRGLARVTFALNYYFAGESHNPSALKFTNVLIHGANALLIYALLSLLVRRHGLTSAGTSLRRDTIALATLYVPLIVALLWALHPVATDGGTLRRAAHDQPGGYVLLGRAAGVR